MIKKPTNLLRIGNILFDLSPKCGSNSVMSSILHDKKLRSASHLDPRSYWNYHDKHAVNEIHPKDITIKVVRNPYNRIVSSFYHFLKSSKLQNMTFIQFLEKTKIMHESNFNLQESEGLFSNINQKYFEMFFLQTNADDIKFDHIIKLENFNEEILKINKFYNTSFKPILKKLNNRKKTEQVLDIEYPTTKFNKFQGRLPADYRLMYNDRSIELVEEIYGEDIDNFNYTRFKL